MILISFLPYHHNYVFTKEVNTTYNTQDIQVQEPVKLNFYFSKFIILQKMDNINITKSPGPDSIHPRILYEIRHEILQPLYILFNTSYQLGKILMEWKTSNSSNL